MVMNLRPDYQGIIAFKAKLNERLRNFNPELAREVRNVKLPWYLIRNADGDIEQGDGKPSIATEGKNDKDAGAEVFIYDEIGGSMGVSASQFVEDLNAITADRITVRINSPGGSVFDSIAIYNALVQHPAYVLTRVDALAASGASIIAMAGDEVEMMVGGQLMIHDALGVEQGNAKHFREMATFLDKQSDNIATIYANKAGGDIAEWRALMLKETWMFAQEAVDLGLADKVYMRPAIGSPNAEEEIPDEEPPNPDDSDVMAEDSEGNPMPPKKGGEEEPDGDEPTDEEVDSMIENLMRHQHTLRNRGYKHAGRARAPRPPINTHDEDEFVRALQRALTKKGAR